MFPCEIVLYGTPVFGYGAIYGLDVYKRQLYTYNDQFRVSLEIKPDGGYTRYELSLIHI